MLCGSPGENQDVIKVHKDEVFQEALGKMLGHW